MCMSCHISRGAATRTVSANRNSQPEFLYGRSLGSWTPRRNLFIKTCLDSRLVHGFYNMSKKICCVSFFFFSFWWASDAARLLVLNLSLKELQQWRTNGLPTDVICSSGEAVIKQLWNRLDCCHIPQWPPAEISSLCSGLLLESSHLINLQPMHTHTNTHTQMFSIDFARVETLANTSLGFSAAMLSCLSMCQLSF